MLTAIQYGRKRVYEWYNYRLRTVAGGRFAHHCKPVSIVFLLTELCNAKCIHCDIWKNRGREDNPTPEQYKRVLGDLRQWLGPVQVILSGGEALMRPYAPELVAYGSELGLFVELLTHGYWDELKRIERLARAKPWRITVSLDGFGETHNKVRGRANFFEKTMRTIELLLKLRREENLPYHIRLKNVIMSHNLDDTLELARFATQPGMHVFYQPIEQNYNTVEDPRWWEKTDNWITDTARVVGIVRELMAMKKAGYHIDNSFAQLEAMIPYFENPEAYRLSTQLHNAHERRALCGALHTIECRANGDVLACLKQPPIGNIKYQPIRQMWEQRPRWWDVGCCLNQRCTEAEKKELGLVELR